MLHGIALDGGQNGGRLLAAHHGDTRIGPHEQETRRVSPATHAVIARTIGSANNDGEFRPGIGRYRRDQLGAILGDTASLVFRTDHETGDILQKDQRDTALGAQLDEVRALLGAL